MNGIYFKGANQRFGPPKGNTEEECYTVPAFVGPIQSSMGLNVEVIVCHQMDKQDWDEVHNNGGRIYLHFISGGALIPHYMSPNTPSFPKI